MPLADDDAALDEIAAELAALPPDGFTAARNARAVGTLAKRVKALRKPTVAAWAVNLLVREGELADAVTLGAAMREAQDDLDAAELARLGRQRRALVSALARRAAELSADAGVVVSSAAREGIERTINAAVMDATAAAAAMTARLITVLESPLDDEGAAAAVNGSVADVAPTSPTTTDDLAERRARKAAEKAAREAERAENESARVLAQVEAKRQRAQERVDHVRERIDDLRRDLERLESEASDLDVHLRDIDADRADAAARARDAAKAAARARAVLDD